MPTFSVYDPATGEITGTVNCQSVDVEANTPSGQARIDGSFRGDAYYVTNGAATPRIPMNPVVSGMTISGLPAQTTARVELTAYLVTDGVLELSPDLPGPYSVSLSAPGYLATTVTLA